jgi:hypothetical protein
MRLACVVRGEASVAGCQADGAPFGAFFPIRDKLLEREQKTG